jgi:hypothetical protein
MVLFQMELEFDAVVQSLLTSAADVLLNPMPAFGKQVQRLSAPVPVFRSPHVNRRGNVRQDLIDLVSLDSRT